MNDYPAWLIARWLQGKPLENVQFDRLPGAWREIVGVAFATNGGDRKAAFKKYLDHRPGLSPEKIWGEIMQADPNRPLEETTERRGIHQFQPTMLPLPDVCIPDPKYQPAIHAAGRFYDEFSEWANFRADRSAPSFNDFGGLFAFSALAARRVCLNLGHGPIYPNFYTIGIAPPAQYAKSVSLDCAADVIAETIPFLMLENDLTPEAMVDTLSGKLPDGMEQLPDFVRAIKEAKRRFAGQQAQLMDECSSLFDGFNRDHKADLRQIYLKMYDANRPLDRLTKASGIVYVAQPYLAFYGMTTTRHMKKIMGSNDDWGTGLWSRFIFLTPNIAPRWNKPSIEPKPPPEHLTKKMRFIHEHLPQPQTGEPLPSLSVAITQSAFDAYTEYDKALWRMNITRGGPEESLHASYTRHSYKAMKAAMLFALMDWDGEGNIQITQAHWHKAQALAEEWRLSLHRVVSYMASNGLDTKEERLLELLEQSPEGMSLRDIYRPVAMQKEEAKTILDGLLRDGMVDVRNITPERGGRPTQKYFSTGLA